MVFRLPHASLWRHSILGLSLLTFLLACAQPRTAAPVARDTVLIFSKTQGYRHASIEVGIQALSKIAEDHHYTVLATEDSALLTRDQLQRCAAVVFLNTTGNVLDDAQQEAFEHYIQAGGGFFGIHAASDTEYEHPAWHWYTRLVGAAFNGHPNSPNVREGVLHPTEPRHESVAHLPAEWRVRDEFYDYKRFNTDVNVVLNVDEYSYKDPGKASTSEHPVAWFHEFDGGRAFYTNLGHDPALYQQADVLELYWQGLRYAIGDGRALSYARSAPESWRFSREPVKIGGMGEAVAFAFRPDGQIFVIDRTGGLYHVDGEAHTAKRISEFEVHTEVENGLIGIAFDPEFERNHWLYLFRGLRTAEGALEQRVSRFQLIGEQLDKHSEEVLLRIPIDEGRVIHTAGQMEFDQQGHLWIATGDNTNPFRSSGYAPLDDRPGHELYDAARSAGNTQDLRGKILRIKPLPDTGYAIPSGNLFPNKEDGRPEIYAMGLRNPYRFTIDNRHQVLYWGEVGPDAKDDDDTRGSKGLDEINRATRAGNFGWPFVIGDNAPYAYYDFENQRSLDFVNPQAPINRSRNNTGRQQLPPAQAAWIYYPYALSDRFFELEDGGRSAMVGDVYYSSDYAAAKQRFPDYFDGKLFVFDWMRRWIKYIDVDADGRIRKIAPFFNSGDFIAPVDMEFGPDGSLYVLEYGAAWFQANTDSRLTRVRYNPGDTPPPVARAQVARSAGALPFRAQLSAARDTGTSTDTLRYQWHVLGPDGVRTRLGEGRELEHVFTEPGRYRVELSVTDTEGNSARDYVDIRAGNAKPNITIALEGNRSFYLDDRDRAYRVEVTDAEDGHSDDATFPLERLTLSLRFVSEPEGSADPARQHQAALSNSEAQAIAAGKQWLEQGDCLSCHQYTQASVGPSLHDVAHHYRNDAAAADHLSKKILDGGSGVWGEHAMPPHPQLQPEQSLALARYVLSLARDAQANTLPPLKGRWDLRHPQPVQTQLPLLGKIQSGEYQLYAQYEDRGALGLAPLSDSKRLRLRPTKLAAEHFDARNNVSLKPNYRGRKGVTAAMFDSGFVTNPLSWMKLEDIDLAGIKTIRIAAITQSKPARLELRAGRDDGAVLASATIPANNGKESIRTINLDVSHIASQQDLYFVGIDEQKAGLRFLGLLYVEFIPQ